MAKLSQYKTEHLFLLVGENPLPNWVAAQLLFRSEGTLHLIYSDETFKIAERLKKHLGVDARLLRVDPTDGQDIAQKVKGQLGGLSGTVGLHYTGGTKAMAVHAYRAVEEAWRNRDPKPVFSYLDAGDFMLRIDPDRHEKVLFAVQPKIKDLAALHGAPLREDPPQGEADLWGVATATALARCRNSRAWHAWKRWWGKTLMKQAKSLTSHAVELPQDPQLAEVKAALRQDLKLSPEQAIPPTIVRSLDTKMSWFRGDWLEHYVLAQLLSIASDVRVHDAGMSLATDQSHATGADFDFEFDVAALRGYQFFGITCTTSQDKDTAKQKLFEAYVRARQLGGDEARVGLVCAYESAHRFEREVVQKWRAKDKIKVFGPREWPDLAAYLREWLETAQ
jgi:hypothetical protein